MKRIKPKPKPLCADLYCGLGSRQPEFGGRADFAIKQFVACWTEYPNHVTLRIGNYAPRTVSLIGGTMCYLKNTRFPARFTSGWKVWAPPPEPCKNSVAIWSARIIDFLFVGISAVKNTTLLPRRFSCALLGTISLICGGRDYHKMRAAQLAIRTISCHVFLLTAPAPTFARCTRCRAINFIWSLCGETTTAAFAE